MRRSLAKFNESEASNHTPSWADFITATPELKFFGTHNAPDTATMDLLVVPTIGFDLLCAFVIVRLNRRELIWINVTANPTTEWVARQITEAFPWNEAPRYMIRDRDRIYGAVVTPTACHGHPGQTYCTGLHPGRTALPNG